MGKNAAALTPNRPLGALQLSTRQGAGPVANRPNYPLESLILWTKHKNQHPGGLKRWFSSFALRIFVPAILP